MKKIIKAGATDQTLDVFIQDSTSTTGAGKTGLAYNTASLKCYYRKGATGSATALTLATQTVGGAHSDGGFVEIDATNMPGMYRLDLSDTIVATAGTVTLMLSGATGMAPLPIELQVVAVNLEDSVRMGMTALPNAAADAAGGLPVSDAGGLDLDALNSNVSAILVDTGTTLQAELDGIQADTEDIQSRLPAALTGGGNMKVDVIAISGSTASADNLERSTVGIVLGTVGSSSSTTSIVTSSLDPAAAAIDQFKGRIVTFDRATTTANLRGQSTDITANTALGVLTVTALTDAPASGDTFVIT